jgi:hypothetical protein
LFAITALLLTACPPLKRKTILPKTDDMTALYEKLSGRKICIAAFEKGY